MFRPFKIMDPVTTKSEREALKAIYRLTRDRPAAQTGALADALGLVPGTVTVTVKRLAERGLVDHRPYRGVELTGDGRAAAVAAIRRHRIVERFLADMLGYPWQAADRLAPSFEHDLPVDVVAFLDTLGVRPGVRVEVREKHPFDGPVVLRVDGQDRTLGSKVAHQVFVRKEARQEMIG